MVKQHYTSHYTQSEINEGDSLGNNATVNGTLLVDNVNLTGYSATDNSSTTSTISTDTVNIVMATEAQNGEDALHQLDVSPFDQVITDISMPIMDGHALARAIRQREAVSALPMTKVVGLTAYIQPEVSAMAVSAGMNECHVKPIGQTQLSAMLNHWFAHATIPLAPITGSSMPVGANMPDNRLRNEENGYPGPALLGILLDNVRDDLKEAQQELNEGDMVALKARAHRIKGPFKTLGWKPLVDACVDLEDSTTMSTDPRNWQRALDHLHVLAQAQLQETTRLAV